MMWQELESLLDDDEDMADLYLTKRGETQEKWRNTIVALEQSAAERGERGRFLNPHAFVLMRSALNDQYMG